MKHILLVVIDRSCDFEQGVIFNKPINIELCQQNRLYRKLKPKWTPRTLKFRVKSILNYETLELAFTDHKNQNDAKSGVSILRPFGTNLTIGVLFLSPD